MSNFLDIDDLDNPGNQGKKETPATPATGADELGLATVPKPAPQGQTQTPKERVAQMMDEWRKTIYVIDCSGSMTDPIPDMVIRPKEEPAQAQPFAGADPFADILDDLDEEFEEEEEDPILKAHPVVPPPKSIEYSRTRQAKIEVAKEMLRRAIRDRYDKYPDSADVNLITFGMSAELRKAANKADLLAMVDVLRADKGGTNITKGAERAVQHCKQSPSPVHLHNVILVTDGCDHGALNVENNLLPTMIERGIVFDVIVIMSLHETMADDRGEDYLNNVHESLKRVCERTNGQFVKVKTAEDLTAKFLEAAKRLALPPAPDKV